MKNNLAFFKNVAGLSGCFYSFLFPLSLRPFPYPNSQKLECKENYSYEILGEESINKENYLKKYPALLFENEKKNLNVYKVSYDLNKKIGTINGSSLMVMAGNLEAKQEVRSTKELDEVPNKRNSQEIIRSMLTENYSVKNALVPVTLFSSYKNLEIQRVDENASLNKKTFRLEEKKFFTIEDAYSSTPKFTFTKIFREDNEVINVDPNDKETETLDLEQIILVSIGKCQPLKN